MTKDIRPLARSWIGVDWGSSNLRAWHMRSDGSALARAGSDQGITRMQTADDFEPVLLDLIQAWLDVDKVVQVISCGMVGSRSDWCLWIWSWNRNL